MILRRLTEHVRTQNWFAVGLDFVIVVVGVFIGIQVSNWNEAQKEREEGKAILVRLINEAGQTLSAIAEYRSVHAANIGEVLGAVAQMEDEARCGSYDLVEQQQLMNIGNFPPPRFSLTAAREATSTGQLQLIKSASVREAVRLATIEMDFISAQWQRYAQIKLDAEAVWLDAGLVQTEPIDDVLRKEVDAVSIGSISLSSRFALRTPEKLCGRPDLAALVSSAAMTQAFYVQYLDQAARNLTAYEDKLQAYKDSQMGMAPAGEASE